MADFICFLHKLIRQYIANQESDQQRRSFRKFMKSSNLKSFFSFKKECTGSFGDGFAYKSVPWRTGMDLSPFVFVLNIFLVFL